MSEKEKEKKKKELEELFKKAPPPEPKRVPHVERKKKEDKG